MDKIKVGIVSENCTNDGEPIAILLERTFPHRLDCRQLNTKFTDNKYGSALDTEKFSIQLEAICAEYEPDMLIFVRDLDKDTNKKKRIASFEENRKRIQPDSPEPPIICLHLLFIYEIEALALTDWTTTKKVLEWHNKKQKMPKSVKAETKEAKELLKLYFKYSEGGMKKLVEYFDLNILKNYTIWRDFIEKLTVFFIK
jgi:hypothetical protein